MARRKRLVVIVLIVLVLLFGLELGREEFVYLYLNNYMEHAYWRIRPGQTKEQVTEILGPPDRMQKEVAQENWYWSAREQQGWLWQKTGLTSLKKYYQLTVIFDQQNTVTDFFAETK